MKLAPTACWMNTDIAEAADSVLMAEAMATPSSPAANAICRPHAQALVRLRFQPASLASSVKRVESCGTSVASKNHPSPNYSA